MPESSLCHLALSEGNASEVHKEKPERSRTAIVKEGGLRNDGRWKGQGQEQIEGRVISAAYGWSPLMTNSVLFASKLALQAFNEKRREPALAKTTSTNKLLRISLNIFDFH
jgi:hypothetical protein